MKGSGKAERLKPLSRRAQGSHQSGTLMGPGATPARNAPPEQREETASSVGRRPAEPCRSTSRGERQQCASIVRASAVAEAGEQEGGGGLISSLARSSEHALELVD
jgi:hypothetical protein